MPTVALPQAPSLLAWGCSPSQARLLGTVSVLAMLEPSGREGVWSMGVITMTPNLRVSLPHRLPKESFKRNGSGEGCPRASPAARQWVTGSQLMGRPGLTCQSCGMAGTLRGCRSWGLEKGHQQLGGWRDGEDEAWPLPLPPARHVPLNTRAVISSPPDTSSIQTATPTVTFPAHMGAHTRPHTHSHVTIQSMSAQQEGPDAPKIPLSLLSFPPPSHPTPKNLLAIPRPVAWFSRPWKVRISLAQAILVLQRPICPLCPTPRPSHTQHSLASSVGYLERGPPPLHPLPAVLSWHTPMLPGLWQTSGDWSWPGKPQWTELLGSEMQKPHIQEVNEQSKTELQTGS